MYDSLAHWASTSVGPPHHHQAPIPQGIQEFWQHAKIALLGSKEGRRSGLEPAHNILWGWHGSICLRASTRAWQDSLWQDLPPEDERVAFTQELPPEFDRTASGKDLPLEAVKAYYLQTPLTHKSSQTINCVSFFTVKVSWCCMAFFQFPSEALPLYWM